MRKSWGVCRGTNRLGYNSWADIEMFYLRAAEEQRRRDAATSLTPRQSSQTHARARAQWHRHPGTNTRARLRFREMAPGNAINDGWCCAPYPLSRFRFFFSAWERTHEGKGTTRRGRKHDQDRQGSDMSVLTSCEVGVALFFLGG